MGRLTRSERLALKGRPKRRAAKTHFFKYQLAANPSRAEENDLKRALQESLEEHGGRNGIKNNNNVASNINSSDVSRSNNSSSSNESAGSTKSATSKRTRSSTPNVNTPVTKRAKYSATNGHQNKCDGNSDVKVESSPIIALPQINNTNSRAIRTYSRSQPELRTQDHGNSTTRMKTSTPIITPIFLNDKETRSKDPSQSSVSKSTQTLTVRSKISLIPTSNNGNTTKTSPNDSVTSSVGIEKLQNPDINQTPVHYLKFKRESKNYAYVKMSALKVSTSKSPSNSKPGGSKKSSPNGILHNNSTNKTLKSGKRSPTDISSKGSAQNGKIANHHGPNGKTSPNSVCKRAQVTPVHKNSNPGNNSNIGADSQGHNNDCSPNSTQDLSKKLNQSQAHGKIIKKRVPQGSWSLLGVPEEKVIFLRDDEPPKRLICYPAIKHVEGDVIQVRDSVLLRSGARKTDLPYIAKVCAFWEDAETGGVMMSLYWYYRPEHTEEGRKPHHLVDEIFASRHRDVDSVECIEDKCYVLTFNEYCRYRKRCKMEQVNTTWSLTDVTIPVSNESYPRRNRIPDSDVNQELVFCCRQIYDSRMRRLIKNPLINPKYGHI